MENLKEGLFGEFEKQKASIILYPYRDDIWRDNCGPIAEMMINLGKAIAEFEPVILGVIPELVETVKAKYDLPANMKIVEMKYNDIWTRDSISAVVRNGNGLEIPVFGFNAYGERLYKPFDDDDKISEHVAKMFGYKFHRSPLILEGGNLMTDGNQTIFCVEDALLNPNRNPGKTREEIEEILKKETLSKKVIWIPHGVVNDETDGHIDNVIAFADEKTMLLSWTDDVNNEHYEAVHDIYEILKDCTNKDGEKYNIVKLPIPPLYRRTAEDSKGIIEEDGSFARLEGDPILDTYVNFALVNGGVIVPQFGIPMDQEALEIIKKVFPDRKIVPFYSREASLGGGGLHCLTKHIN